MAKTSKRSKKFIAKSGGAAAALSKKGASLARKGKVKRGAGKKHDSSDGSGRGGGGGGKGGLDDREEEERAANDFMNADNLGSLDVESFFAKAAGLAAGDASDASDEEEAAADGKDDDASESGDDDSDSYASLGSEEEDVEASEARMKAQLEKLSQKDPEFHKYLQENESALLEFGEDEMSEDEEDYEQDEDAMEAVADQLLADEEEGEGEYAMQSQFQKQQKEAEDKFLLTPRRLQQLEQGAFVSHSIKGLKRLVAAYKTACHLSDASPQQDDDGEEEKKKKEFRITSPVVFDRLMAVCLARCHEEFYYHLLEGKKEGGEDDDSSSGSSGDSDEEGVGKPKAKESPAALDENKPLHPKALAQSPAFPSLRPILESFLRATLHLLTEAGKEAKLLQFVLSALSKYIPYLTAVPKLATPLLKACVKLWSAPLDSSEEYNAVRLRAFLRIRQLAITQPYPFIEEALKLTYLAYARRAKFGTAATVGTTLPTLTFMGNCVVELYALDYASAYQHAFVYVRQLALHLRTAMQKRTPEAMGAVCCWQYVHCLKLWVAVLSAACGNKAGEAGDASTTKLGGGAGKDEEANLLRSLVYPLTEIILGTTRLVPVARFVPLRLHCVRLLQQLTASTETFIPTTSLLLGVLDLKEVGMKPLRDGGGKGKKGKKKKSATVRGLRLPLILKLPKEGTLRTAEQLDGVLKETFVLLNREIDLYRYSPGAPEFTYAIVARLRKFNKEMANGRWRAYSKGTIELCEKYAAFAVQGRSTLVDAPKDVRRLEALKPSNVPSMGERYDAAVAKEKRLEAAAQPAMRKKVNADEGRKEAKGKRKMAMEGVGNDSDVDSEEEAAATKKRKKQPKKKKVVVNEADLNNVQALEEEDEVQEGIWSESSDSE
ncbi:hypothetical protein ACHAXT_000056 [Thalassiosira profunda]